MKESDVRHLAAEVLAAIAPEADLTQVANTEALRAALDLDSMDVHNIIIGRGRSAGVKIPEADYPRLFTLQGLITYLGR